MGVFISQNDVLAEKKFFGKFVSKKSKFFNFFQKNPHILSIFWKKNSEFNRCLELSTVYGPKIDFWKNIFIKNADISSACPKKMPTYLVLVWKKMPTYLVLNVGQIFFSFLKKNEPPSAASMVELGDGGGAGGWFQKEGGMILQFPIG